MNALQAAQAKLELIKLQQSGDLAQIACQLEINKTEAANPNPFTARQAQSRMSSCCWVKVAVDGAGCVFQPIVDGVSI